MLHKLKMAETWNKRAKLFANAAKQATGEKKGKYFSLMKVCISATQYNVDEYQRLLLATAGGPRNVDKIRIPSKDKTSK